MLICNRQYNRYRIYSLMGQLKEIEKWIETFFQLHLEISRITADFELTISSKNKDKIGSRSS